MRSQCRITQLESHQHAPMARAVDVPVLREVAAGDADVAIDARHRIVAVDAAAGTGVPQQIDGADRQPSGESGVRAELRPLLVARQVVADGDPARLVAYAEQELARRGHRGGCLRHFDLLRGIAADFLAGGQRNPAAGALEIELEPRFGDAQYGGADIDAENAIARRAVERTSVVRVAGRGAALEMPDRQRAMLGNEHLRDDDVVARRAFQADRPPGIDDLDLAARQGVVTIDIDAVLLGEGGEQAPVAGIDAADQRPTARQHVAALDTTPAPAGRNEDAADQAGGILPYVVLPLVGPLREHEVVGEMLD